MPPSSSVGGGGGGSAGIGGCSVGRGFMPGVGRGPDWRRPESERCGAAAAYGSGGGGGGILGGADMGSWDLGGLVSLGCERSSCCAGGDGEDWSLAWPPPILSCGHVWPLVVGTCGDGGLWCPLTWGATGPTGSTVSASDWSGIWMAGCGRRETRTNWAGRVAGVEGAGMSWPLKGTKTGGPTIASPVP